MCAHLCVRGQRAGSEEGGAGMNTGVCPPFLLSIQRISWWRALGFSLEPVTLRSKWGTHGTFNLFTFPCGSVSISERCIRFQISTFVPHRSSCTTFLASALTHEVWLYCITVLWWHLYFLVFSVDSLMTLSSCMLPQKPEGGLVPVCSFCISCIFSTDVL